MSKRFLTFTLIGVINTIVDISILYLLILIFGNNLLYIPIFNIISYSFGIVSSFILNGRFTFKDKNLTTNKFIKLYTSSIGGLFINTIIIFLLTFFKVNIIISKIVATITVVVYNYIICKRYIYAQNT